ncbi:MAG: hypothetical protein LBB43_04255 [Spirochaetaceae bacterium]|jgi:accessory colonization factor AcfC|nr:hypothetical protein [Spirochaetaceae bacterium]
MKQLLMVLFLSLAFSLGGQEAGGGDQAWTESILSALVEQVGAVNARIDYYHGGGPAPHLRTDYREALVDEVPAWAEVLIQAIESINARIDYYHGGGPAPDTRMDYREKLGNDAPAWTSTLINTVNSINTNIDYYHGARRSSAPQVKKGADGDSVPDWADTVMDDLEAVDTRIKSTGRADFRRALPSNF